MLFTFRMEVANGEPADPPKLETSASNRYPGDSVFVRRSCGTAWSRFARTYWSLSLLRG
jgi:hypothetical protein